MALGFRDNILPMSIDQTLLDSCVGRYVSSIHFKFARHDTPHFTGDRTICYTYSLSAGPAVAGAARRVVATG